MTDTQLKIMLLDYEMRSRPYIAEISDPDRQAVVSARLAKMVNLKFQRSTKSRDERVRVSQYLMTDHLRDAFQNAR